MTGAVGQIGSELTMELCHRYSNENVVSTGHKTKPSEKLREPGPFEFIDVTRKETVEEVVEANRQASYVAREWAVAYLETNRLIARICQRLTDVLADLGVRAASEPATHNFDPVSLVSRWSHKSVAAVAGLGSFGLHHMLITDAGCAGRFGSLVIDAELEPTPVVEKQRCLYYHDGSCRQCVELCPVGALTEEELDKGLCYRRCLEVDAYFADLGLTDVCGKCALGPCALGSAV